ncbi:MAG: hypothetical protein OES84_05665, partial [Kiritimatiellaceae bacterium]|nr:hypothetical protein [Kiritimatiellaceae bacterium]
MRKYQLVILYAFFATGVLAQPQPIQLITVGTPGSINFDRPYGDSIDHFNFYSGNWVLFGVGNVNTNDSIADGSLVFQNGGRETLAPYEQTLNIHHQGVGGLYSISDGGGMDNQVTYVNADSDTCGIASSDGHGIAIGERDSGRSRYGSWHFDDGYYYGASGHSGFAAEHMTAFSAKGTSFVGGDITSADDGSCGIAIGTDTNRNLGATTFEIDNETGKYADRIQAGSYTGGGTTTTKRYIEFPGSLWAWRVSAVGGSGVYLDNATSAIIHGGDFYGSQVLTTEERIAQNTGAELHNASALAGGGQGAYLGTSTTINSGYFKGGQAGTAICAGDGAIAHAGGGEGAYIDGNATIKDATFLAGRAGSAVITSSVYWNSADRTISTSANGAKAYASGGSGVRVRTGTATLTDVNATGSNAGSATA